MTAIIDYDAGNIKSVYKALEYLNDKPELTRDRKKILQADHVILPGVGSFGDAMGRLDSYGLCDTIHEVIDKGTPFLGICLGLQLLFESSEESPGVRGLSILKGEIVRFPGFTLPLADGGRVAAKIPHMGWNALSINPGKRLFQGINDQAYVYFVHSYYLMAEEKEDVAASTMYGIIFDSSVEHGNVFACQFHPEKSGSTGLKILENFIQV